MIVKTDCETDGSFYSTNSDRAALPSPGVTSDHAAPRALPGASEMPHLQLLPHLRGPEAARPVLELHQSHVGNVSIAFFSILGMFSAKVFLSSLRGHTLSSNS